MERAKNIILIGFKSCGKSTTGAMLAQQRGMNFVDTDTLIEQRHVQQTGEHLSFREIYQQRGRDYFLEQERAVIAGLADLNNYVIAAGGGTFINHPVPPELRQRAQLIYLNVAPETLLARIREGGTPAFFTSNDIESEFRSTFASRHPIYLALADSVIDADKATPEAIVERIVQTTAVIS